MRYSHLHLLLCCTLFLSCNLFDTRDPEDPVSNNQTLPTAFTKEILFSNLKLSMEQKNILEYEKLFSDSSTHLRRFTFIPNQSAAARYASFFAVWNREMEKEYFRNAVSSIGAASSIQLQITSGPVIVPYQGDSAQYSFDYSLFIPHSRSDVNIQQFAGRCEITMSPEKNNPVWRIYRWIDYETKKDSSWSELKGQFAK